MPIYLKKRLHRYLDIMDDKILGIFGVALFDAKTATVVMR
jgi:hypothetical protein